MRHSLMMIAVLALAACGSEEAPTGQVVATVDGEEITQSELNAAIGGRRASTAEQQKQLQQAVLDQMIARVILANAAKEQGLDETPEAAMAKRQAEQAALIGLLEKKLSGSTAKASDEQVSQYVLENTDLFANRRIYVVDQIAVPAPSRDLLKALEPLNTLAEVKAELARRNIDAPTTLGVIDSLTMPPAAAKQIAALPADAVFIVPAPGGIRINHIKESQTSPITGENAEKVANELIVRNRSGKQVRDAVAKLVQEGRAKVQYNPAFKPPPPPKGGQPNGGAAKTDG